MTTVQISDAHEKRRIARGILEALPEWFGIAQAREEYIAASAAQPFFAALDGDRPVGFLCLGETGRDTVEIHVMGVLKEAARAAALEGGYSFMQVKTVQMGRYDEYDRTNRFYLALGFKEFEVFPTLWDEWNPCQIYVMALR